MADQPVVGIIMGSKSDLATMEGCTAELERLGVPYELVIASAHRTPDKVHPWPQGNHRSCRKGRSPGRSCCCIYSTACRWRSNEDL